MSFKIHFYNKHTVPQGLSTSFLRPRGVCNFKVVRRKGTGNRMCDCASKKEDDPETASTVTEMMAGEETEREKAESEAKEEMERGNLSGQITKRRAERLSEA